ncbi:MAG: exodeoxyribonuclease VII large subunit [Balneolaceae bacterium]|nr:exodeoxyribonuclease VII large subunit [Balneolaceae bacterium]
MSKQIPFLFDIPTVTELTDKIKALLEKNFVDILVEGEASNVKRSANGHIYFTLKDAGAQLPCVIWRNTAQRLGIDLMDGQQIVVGGDIQVYAPHGRYQMIVGLVQQAGIGKLQQAFEALKAKLKAEGLFEDIHKKPIPKYPKRIGVVTSKTTAAFQDIRSTLEKRWPIAEVLLYHASVQGVNAAPEIVKGIQYFSTQQNVDVVLISRGGGSLEDLWAFNEESVARAVFECEVPLISAVGHEVDFSISDFVADLRAATPTQAAVFATPDINEVRMLVEDLHRKLEMHTSGSIQYYKDRVASLSKSYALLAVQQKMKLAGNEVARLKTQLRQEVERILTIRKHTIEKLSQSVVNQNPNTPLEKGFVRVWQQDRWIRSKKDYDSGTEIKAQWLDGEIIFK